MSAFKGATVGIWLRLFQAAWLALALAGQAKAQAYEPLLDPGYFKQITDASVEWRGDKFPTRIITQKSIISFEDGDLSKKTIGKFVSLFAGHAVMQLQLALASAQVPAMPAQSAAFRIVLEPVRAQSSFGFFDGVTHTLWVKVSVFDKALNQYVWVDTFTAGDIAKDADDAAIATQVAPDFGKRVLRGLYNSRLVR